LSCGEVRSHWMKLILYDPWQGCRVLKIRDIGRRIGGRRFNGGSFREMEERVKKVGHFCSVATTVKNIVYLT